MSSLLCDKKRWQKAIRSHLGLDCRPTKPVPSAHTSKWAGDLIWYRLQREAAGLQRDGGYTEQNNIVDGLDINEQYLEDTFGSAEKALEFLDWAKESHVFDMEAAGLQRDGGQTEQNSRVDGLDINEQYLKDTFGSAEKALEFLDWAKESHAF